MEKKRDISIDIIRGIAIFIMLGANVVGYVTSCELHPLWFNIVSSFAAPLFVLLSGYMTAVNSARKHTSVSYYMLRGGMLIITAALIDSLIWLLVPFATFDVLYVIGIGMIVVFLLEKTSIWVKTGFIVIVLIITAILQHYWEYMKFPMEIEFLSKDADYSSYTFFNVIKALLYDGWFPLFPWIAVPVLGSIFAHFRKKLENGFANIQAVVVGVILTVAGFAWLYFAYSGEKAFDALIMRDPYGEIFYPPTLPFMIGVSGVCLLVFALVDKTRNVVIWQPLTVFGQTSLFNYILHSAIVAFIVYPYFEDNLQPLYIGWIVYALLVIASFILSYGVVLMKRKVKTKNFFFNFYFGG